MARLTLKLTGHGPMLVAHEEVDGPVTPDAFARAVAAAKDALQPSRPGRRHTATRGTEEPREPDKE